MAHNITNGMIAWKGEKPWHGLGTDVSQILQSLTPAEQGAAMLKAAKMDWKVQRRALAMRDFAGQGLLSDPLKGYRAIVRLDTDEVFQVATDRYHPVQNTDIVEFFREYCEAGHAELEVVGALQGGSKIWALAKLNGATKATLPGDDKLEGRLLLATSHDGSLRTIAKAVQTRVVCWNTLQAALGEDSKREFRMKHTRKWSSAVASEAREVMGMAIQQIQETNELARDLSKIHIDADGRVEFVLRVLGGESLLEQAMQDADGSLDSIIAATERKVQQTSEEKMGRVGKAVLEAILNSPGSDMESANGTLWGAVNGVTYYADHIYGRNQDNRMAASWFGAASNLKQQAVTVARDMAAV